MAAAAHPTAFLRALDEEVHVWLTRPDDVGDSEHLAACHAMLSDEERGRLARFRRESDRRGFLAAHALVRSALSRYAEVPPEGWSFAANHWGRPEIAGPGAAPALRFSLSHTSGLTAVAVALDRDCGVDVEAFDRRGDPLKLARRVLSPKEIADLEERVPGTRRDCFLAYWTLKEAYVKARGLGLSLPLREFSFSLAGERIRIEFATPGDDVASSWQFASLRPTPRHVLAIAVRHGDGPERRIIVRETLPGAD
jgi:4'-phosphopantetheinyl transferase